MSSLFSNYYFNQAVIILDSTNSTGKTSGSLLLYGGMAVTGDNTFSGQTHVVNTVGSTSSSTGAFIIDGGIGIKENIYMDGFITSGGFYGPRGTVTNWVVENGTYGTLVGTNITSTNANITNLTTDNMALTNLLATRITTTNLIATSSVTCGNDLVVNGSITSGALYAPLGTVTNWVVVNGSVTNLRGTNSISTNLTSANIFASTSTFGEINATLTTIGHLWVNTSMVVQSSITAANDIVIGGYVTAASLYTPYSTINNLIGTNSTYTNSIIENGSTTNLISSAITSANIFATSSVTCGSDLVVNGHITSGALYAPLGTVTNWVVVNGSTTNLVSSAITSANIFATSSVTCGSDLVVNGHISTSNIYSGIISGVTIGSSVLNSTTISSSNMYISNDMFIGGTLTTVNITATNIVETNVSAGIVYVSTSFAAVGDSNTLGNLFTTNGNIGIGTTAPNYTLDVIGTGNFSSSITSSSVYATNSTIINGVFTNLSTANISLGQLGASNISVSSITAGNAIFVNSTTTNAVITNSSTSSATIINSTTSNAVITSMSASSSVLTNLSTTNVSSSTLSVNNRDMTPSGGDLATEYYANITNGTTGSVSGFSFSNSIVRAFYSLASVEVKLAVGPNLYANFELKGIQNVAGWRLNYSFIGDNTGVTFNIDNSGQIIYTSSSQANWISTIVRYRATTTSVTGGTLII